MLSKIRKALTEGKVIWRQHVLPRMLERNISSRQDVFNTIHNGDVIESYLESNPYPSCLIAGYSGNRQVHVVAAWDDDACAVYLITVYTPDRQHFQENGITRKVKE
jgi:hypothetical protein